MSRVNRWKRGTDFTRKEGKRKRNSSDLGLRGVRTKLDRMEMHDRRGGKNEGNKRERRRPKRVLVGRRGLETKLS